MSAGKVLVLKDIPGRGFWLHRFLCGREFCMWKNPSGIPENPVNVQERPGLKQVSPETMGSAPGRSLFILYVKHAHIVGVKGETGRCSRQMKGKKKEKKSF